MRAALVVLSLAVSAVAFVPHSPTARVLSTPRALRPAPLRMAGDAELVQVEEETIKTSTAIVGGAAGFLFGGPVGILLVIEVLVGQKKLSFNLFQYVM
jgi:hypothetical protein